MSTNPDIAAVLSGEARWCVVQGDALDVLKEIPDLSVDHVVADPPYSAHTHGGMRGNRGEAGIVTRDCGFAHLSPRLRSGIAHEACRIARGWIALFSDWEGTTWWRLALNGAGGSYRRSIPWVRWSSPQFNGQAPPTGSEAVIIAKPISRKRQWLNGSRTHYDTKCLRSSNKAAGHPTEKPQLLMTDILRDFALSGDVILDCCCGSGTTGAAALGLGMRFIGIENDPTWAQRARERIIRDAPLLNRRAST